MSIIEKKIMKKKIEYRHLVSLLFTLTILHVLVNIFNLSKFNSKLLNFNIIFNTFYIDLVVLIISYFIYKNKVKFSQ